MKTTYTDDGLFICRRKTYHADEGTSGYVYEEVGAYKGEIMTQNDQAARQIIDQRIAVYRKKIEFENGSEQTKDEMRFAIEALEIVKSALQVAPPVAEGDISTTYTPPIAVTVGTGQPQPPADVSEDEREQIIAAFDLAEQWLLNSIPTVHLESPKPLPVIRALREYLTHAAGESK